jgi:hypothetical protein
MAKPDKGATENKKKATAPASSADPAFDRWLEQGLQQIYGAVLTEPVPDELVQLIRDHKDKKK